MNAGVLAPGYAPPVMPRPLLGGPQPVPTPYGQNGDPFWRNVELLLRCDQRHNVAAFSDLSKNLYPVTVYGDARSSSTSQFFGRNAVATGNNSDATSNKPNAAGLPGAVIACGTSDFTIECFYLRTVPITSSVCLLMAHDLGSSGSNRLGFQVLNTNTLYFFVFGNAIAQSAALTWNLNQWYHLAVGRTGTSLRIWRDGQTVATATNSTNFLAEPSRANCAPSNPGHFITELRVTRGVSRYTAATFAPPTAPFPVGPTTTITRNADPFFSSVSLLLRMDGQNGATSFPDLSNNALVATVSGNTQTSTADSPFGGASGLFDGTADFLQYSDTTPFDLTGDFTIEFWFKTTSTKSYATVFSRRANSAATNIVAITINNTVTGDIGIFVGGTASFFATSTGSNVCDGQWHHVATTRSGNTLTVFVDGVSRASATSNPGTISFAANVPTQIGRDRFYTARDFDGRLAEFRITRGVARYSGNFTTPTSPFPGY